MGSIISSSAGSSITMGGVSAVMRSGRRNARRAIRGKKKNFKLKFWKRI